MNVEWAILPIFVGGLIAAAFGWYFAKKEQKGKHIGSTTGAAKVPHVQQEATPPAHALH